MRKFPWFKKFEDLYWENQKITRKENYILVHYFFLIGGLITVYNNKWGNIVFFFVFALVFLSSALLFSVSCERYAFECKLNKKKVEFLDFFKNTFASIISFSIYFIVYLIYIYGIFKTYPQFFPIVIVFVVFSVLYYLGTYVESVKVRWLGRSLLILSLLLIFIMLFFSNA